jgi:tetratricopeptide (TPR) repeat protein
MPGPTSRALVWAEALRLPAAFLLTVASPVLAAAPSPGLLDLEARVEYGYFTEDRRTLEGLTAGPSGDDAKDGMRSYYSGLAGYRLALVESARDVARARVAAEECVSSLDRALRASPAAAPAESMALQSACLEELSQLSALRSPLAGTRSKSQMEKAVRLAPRNPRVLLLDAVVAYERAANGADGERALGKLKKAIVALEGERQEVVHVPGWGLADAYTHLGRIYLNKGETVAARDALEHALLAAPEFQQARRLMTKITSG